MKSMLSTAAVLLLVGGCARQADAPAQAQAPAAASAPAVASAPDLKSEHARWVSDREASLRKPDGWASLTGLHWIEGSEQRVGSGASNDIKLLIGPETLGTVRQQAGVVSFLPAAHADLTVDGRPVPGAIELKPAGEGGPGTTLAYDAGKGKINLIQRGNALALRVHHADAPTRQHFAGLDFWPAQPEWVVDARFVPYPPGKSIAIVNVIGDTNEVPNPGYLQFEKDGKTWRLEAFGDPSKGLNLMFKDATSGKESYGVGRYLQTGAVGSDGHVAVDFNRAYNPPCAYTDFATCPIPPRENNLAHQQIEGSDASLTVAAGEKSYKGHES